MAKLILYGAKPSNHSNNVFLHHIQSDGVSTNLAMTSVASFFHSSFAPSTVNPWAWFWRVREERKKYAVRKFHNIGQKEFRFSSHRHRCYRWLRRNVNLVICHLCASRDSNIDFNIAIQMQIKKLIQIVQIFFAFMNSVFLLRFFLLIKISIRAERSERNLASSPSHHVCMRATYWQLIGRNGVYCETRNQVKAMDRSDVRATCVVSAGAVYNGKTNKWVPANRRDQLLTHKSWKEFNFNRYAKW